MAMAESRAVEALTIAWMLSCITTLGALGVGVSVRAYVVSQPEPGRLRLFAELLLFAAMVAGLVTLLLTPLTLKLRKVAPPRLILVAAVVIGLLPLIILLW